MGGNVMSLCIRLWDQIKIGSAFLIDTRTSQNSTQVHIERCKALPERRHLDRIASSDPSSPHMKDKD